MNIRVGDKVRVKDTGKVGILLTITRYKNEYAYVVDVGADGPPLIFQRSQLEFVL